MKTGRVRQFSSLNLPLSFSKENLEAAIIELIKHGHGITFNHIGIGEDWDHAHLIMSSNDETAKGLIFHTQEGRFPINLCFLEGLECTSNFFDNFRQELYEVHGLLNGLDPSQRSWIYLFELQEISLANTLVFDERPSNVEIKLWEGWKNASTVTDGNIDPAKLGFDFYFEKESGQIMFHRINCSVTKDIELEETNILNVSAGGVNTCLYLFTTNYGRPDLK